MIGYNSMCRHKTVKKVYVMCGWGLGKGGYSYECQECFRKFSKIPKETSEVIDKFKNKEKV